MEIARGQILASLGKAVLRPAEIWSRRGSRRRRSRGRSPVWRESQDWLALTVPSRTLKALPPCQRCQASGLRHLSPGVLQGEQGIAEAPQGHIITRAVQSVNIVCMVVL